MVQLDNAIGDAAVKHLADTLKVNTTLTSLDLDSELCVLFVFFCISFSSLSMSLNILTVIVRCNIANHFGEDGVIDIGEALRVNSTLVNINLQRACVCFSYTSHPFVSRYCNKRGCCQPYCRRVESELNLNFHAAKSAVG